MTHITKQEQDILDAFNQGKGVGYVEGMRAAKAKNEFNPDWDMLQTLTEENIRLAKELDNQGEPVAWKLAGKLHEIDPSDWATDQYPNDKVIPLYTTPQTKPLSDEEIDEILDRLIDEDEGCSYHDFARAIEDKHGIKNV